MLAGAFACLISCRGTDLNEPGRSAQQFHLVRNQLKAPATRACTPVDRVGSMIGANRGEWLLGTSASRSSSAALRRKSGASPPIYQNTEGAPAAEANSPKSSL